MEKEYRKNKISPHTVMTFHVTEKQKNQILKIQKKLNKDSHTPLAQVIREAVINKVKNMDLKGKRLKKEIFKTERVSVSVSKSLFKKIKLAVQESKEKNLSEFMRAAIEEYYMGKGKK